MNIICGLALVLCSFRVGSIFIVLSYALILKIVLDIVAGRNQPKALLWISLIVTAFILHFPLIALALIHRIGGTILLFPMSQHPTSSFSSHLSSTVLKTKQIRSTLCRLFTLKIAEWEPFEELFEGYWKQEGWTDILFLCAKLLLLGHLCMVLLQSF